MESAVSFSNGHLKLRGILHTPDGPRARAGVILLCPGYKHRVGQHRLYLYIARTLSAHGLPVLRFDFHGLGESAGEIKRCLFDDFWGYIQRGGFVSDTIASVDFFREIASVEKVALMGLCGGAITGLIAGARDSRVDGLILINVSIALQGSSDDWFTKNMPPGLADSLLSAYVERIKSPRSWVRLLTLKSDYRVIWKSISSKLGRRWRSSGRIDLENDTGDSHVNPLFLESFRSYCSSGRPVLFAFSENDKEKWAFDANVLERYLYSGNPYEKYYSISVVEGANHSFTLPEWRDELLDTSLAWLQHHLEAVPAGEGSDSKGINDAKE